MEKYFRHGWKDSHSHSEGVIDRYVKKESIQDQKRLISDIHHILDRHPRLVDLKKYMESITHDFDPKTE